MISDDVRRFVLTSIPSVPYLEAVLLFHHSAAVERDAGEVARALYVPEPRAQELLDLLLSAGILASCPGVPPRWRFEPRDEALRLAIHELALAYPSDVIAITHLIHDSAGRNAHMFADAFRIRKD